MTLVNTSYPDFSAGEISPRVYGRFDIQAFYRSGRRVRNFIPETVGGAKYRTGTYYVSETAGNSEAFLFPFVYTDSVAFIMEFTPLKLRFYRDDGIVESSPGVPVEVVTPYGANDLWELKFAQDNDVLYITHPSYQPRKLTYTSPTSWALTAHAPVRKTRQPGILISAVSQANPAVVTYSGSDVFSNGESVYIDNAVGMTQLNGREFTIANVNTGSNTFELVGEDSSGYSSYTGAGLVRRITSANAPFLTSGNYPGAVGFYEQRLVYGGSNNDPNKLWFSKPGEPDDFSLQQGTTAEVDDGIEYVIAGNSAKINWLKGTEKFLGVGALNDVLQVTGGIDNVVTSTSISIRPSNSFGVADTMPIGRGSQIFYIQSNSLTVRSFEYDFQRDGYVPVDRNTLADHITKTGLKQIDFQESRPNIVWATRNDGALVGMTLEEQESVNGWHIHSTDGEFISVASLPRSGKYDQVWVCVKRVIDGAAKYYVEYLTEETIFPRREDFVLSSDANNDFSLYRNMLYESQRTYIHLDCALSYYGDMIGLDAGADVTPGAITGSGVTFTASAAVFDSGMIGRYIVRKSITGAEYGVAEITGYTTTTSVTCTILEDFDSTTEIVAGEWYLTTDTLTGCDHLEGKTVSIVTDGGQHPQYAVASGTVALTRQSAVVHIGLPYTGYLETNELEGGGTNGPAQTKKKALFGIGFRFLDTLYAKFGTGYYRLSQIEMRTAAMRMDRPPELFSGDTYENYSNQGSDDRDGGWNRSIRAIVCQDQPFPCKLQLVIPYFATSN